MSSLFGLGGGGNVGASGSVYSYNIDQSLRVDDTASQRMYHNTVAGDAQKFTMSCWIKRTELSDSGTIMSSWNGASNFVNMYFSGDNLYCYICDNRSGFVDYNFNTSASTDGNIKYRDVGAWMHVVFAVDSTQSTATDRFTIWVNGVNTNARSGGTGNDIPLNYNMEINEAGGQNFLFHNPDSSAYYGSFYIANMVYVDGTKYDADTFGEFKNGIWTPLDISAQSITFGNNGFYLDFADSSDLGKDVSGEGHHFTSGTRSAVVNNFDAHDQVPDSPTNNFATINVLDSHGASTYTEGNLNFADGGGDGATCLSTFVIPDIADTTTYYIELLHYQGYAFGIAPETYSAAHTITSRTGILSWYSNGNLYDGSSIHTSSWSTASTTGEIRSMVVGNGQVEYFRNGTSLGVAFTGLTGAWKIAEWAVGAAGTGVTFNFGQDDTFAGAVTSGSAGSTDANGYGKFYYSEASSHTALCSANLPEPAIGPNSGVGKQSEENFNTLLYTGDNTASRAITGTGFQADLIWLKARNTASYHHQLHDSVRGASAGALYSSLTNVEDSSYPITSFDSDGFTTKSGTQNGQNTSNTYVAWNWKAGGTAVSNTDGTNIASSVSANPDAGMSIVSWTGTGVGSDSVGHGLTQKPEMVICKARTSAGVNYWHVNHKDLTASDYNIFLNLTSAETDVNTNYAEGGIGLGDASVIDFIAGYSGANNVANCNNSSSNFIAYCFHSVEGHSRVTSYVGNASTDGTFCYLGHRPAWIMLKNASASGSWYIFDVKRNTYNAMDNYLRPNLSNAEGTLDFCDFTSNGFKIRSSAAEWNGSGNTIIVLSFAEAPFKYANAR